MSALTFVPVKCSVHVPKPGGPPVVTDRIGTIYENWTPHDGVAIPAATWEAVCGWKKARDLQMSLLENGDADLWYAACEAVEAALQKMLALIPEVAS